MRERFDNTYIQSELERIGTQLETPLTVYLIGGGAMAFRDLKETTKDIDLVVTSGDDLRVLQAVLHDCGYDIVKQPGEAYDDLGAQRIFENDDSCRIDLFNQQVVDKLILSDEMRQRSDPFLDTGRLTVELVSREDIFLFKSVAGRTDDIEDMFALVQTGLEFDATAAEIDRQIDLLGQELFVSYINESLIELEARHNVTPPVAEMVAEITERVYIEIELLGVIDESILRSELVSTLGFSPTQIEKALQNLERKGVVKIEDDRITKQSTTL